mmetsp:Transcript_28931/g.42902  ORF Transcript_28931/g.42902 Transcript_28931/m.42902 type:complete len:415 (+) Transcript_28931:77-1321(+)|eukprot:CAMPEP_0195513512 /NCGR_PEP_ID=MMETSP0794_2-20130614/5151_1 /TAXON_ID=515487 /ORGANISM="Stephanopyxis turris, Strain CCMP 815" /LENGTH=414 /DNA_ID=CAMNT_0040641545 /DNA_START=70 /DNA_END=1314 /DNA_ORIENTATION=+
MTESSSANLREPFLSRRLTRGRHQLTSTISSQLSSAAKTNNLKPVGISKETKTVTAAAISSNAKLSPSTSTRQEYPRWHNAVAGAAAGAGARLLCAPLDLLKIRRQIVHSQNTVSHNDNIIQSFQKIAQNEGGIRALFRGNVAATYLWIGYAMIQFSFYARTSAYLTSYEAPPAIDDIPFPQQLMHKCRKSLASNPSAVAFTSGATAGVCATLATYPFDICRTSFAARGLSKTTSTAAASMRDIAGSSKPPESLAHFAQTMLKNHGFRGFFAGVGPGLIQVVPYMGINFALYDLFTRFSDKHNVGGAGVAGTFAGGISKFLVYPMDTVKKRLQANTFLASTSSGSASALKYTGMVDCIVSITRDEGINAFYRGLAPTILKSMAATGASFAFFTLMKNSLETVHNRTEGRYFLPQ